MRVSLSGPMQFSWPLPMNLPARHQEFRTQQETCSFQTRHSAAESRSRISMRCKYDTCARGLEQTQYEDHCRGKRGALHRNPEARYHHSVVANARTYARRFHFLVLDGGGLMALVLFLVAGGRQQGDSSSRELSRFPCCCRGGESRIECFFSCLPPKSTTKLCFSWVRP